MSQFSFSPFFRYFIAGTSTAGLELFLFLFLSWLGVWYVVANSVAFGVAVCYGFFIQKYWTFKNREKNTVYQIISFAGVMVVAYFLANIYLYIFIDYFGWRYDISKVIQLFLVFLSNYFLQAYITFRKKKV